MSFVAAERIARIGLLRTTVFSRIPSNIFLSAVPFAPSAVWALALICRQSLSQMDVPTRQSYTMALIEERDRTVAAGFTSVSRTVPSSGSPSLAGYAIANIGIGSPILAAGTFKLIYDFLIYYSFRKTRPTEKISTKR